MDKYGLSGKVIVISGGSRGLGRALVQRFLSMGTRVAVISRTSEGIDRLRNELGNEGELLLFGGDIGNAAEVRAFMEAVLGRFGSIDVLVNNASILGERKSIVDYDIDSWRKVFMVNLDGAFLLTKAFLPSMISKKQGSIINVSSSVGRTGRGHWGAYAVSKFGLEGLTQVLADELKEDGIRVNSVNPGGMATDMRHSAFPEEDPATLPTAADHLGVYLYLASELSNGISGKAFDARTFGS